MSLCLKSLRSPERAESDVLEGVKLRLGRMAAVKQPGQVLRSYWAHCPSWLGVLALEATATVLTDGRSSRAPSIAID